MANEAVAAFFENLDNLSTGDRAALKREAGTMLPQAKGQAVRVFYQNLPYKIAQYQEGVWFAAGCLHCLWSRDTAQRADITQVLYQLRSDPSVSESTVHRVEGLLDIEWDNDGYMLTKLTRLMKLIISKGLAVDCAGLLEDLLHWNSDSQWVQRKWARGMYMRDQNSGSETGTEKGEN